MSGIAPRARARAVLGRFPRHLEAESPGKILAWLADALAADLDQITGQLGRVRRSHRLAHADEPADLVALGDLHGLGLEDLELLRRRLVLVRSTLETIADDPDAAAARLLLSKLLPWPTEAFDGAEALKLLSPRFELELIRRRWRMVIALHRQGGGTARTLLAAAANALDLDVAEISHLEDGFWHVARAEDRLRTPQISAQVAADLLALEENPMRPKERAATAYAHGRHFSFLRGGFGEVPVSVVVTGLGEHTFWPMVVHVQSGTGVAFAGAVPDGSELVFGADGRVTLEGQPANQKAYGFRGAVFAAGAPHDAGTDYDFVFADASQPGPDDAVFSVSQPIADAFDPEAPWPHGGGLIESPKLRVGDNRWAFFVRLGHAGTRGNNSPEPPSPPLPNAPGDLAATPIFDAAIWDASVFGSGLETPPKAGQVGFRWQEREPFAVRLWLPQRFTALDIEGETPAAERLRAALRRHAAAGIHVYTEYADDQWTLDEGLLPQEGTEGALRAFTLGTRLWPDGTPQPTPET